MHYVGRPKGIWAGHPPVRTRCVGPIRELRTQMQAKVTGMGVQGRVKGLSGSRMDRAWEPDIVRVWEGVGTRDSWLGRQGR